MATFDLHAKICASTHLLSFWASSGHQKPLKTKLEVFVPKIVPKIYNNFTDTYNMSIKLCWLTNMTKMNIYL